ncbi:hypothetical protein FEM48_Zijuj02G0188100 [Ziziphus jujuba var. spinosa]|uniref:Kri1-like C-terminal domain-containing protein n=1 Tax=Ziziphus jujuba var. spinosa TaxID=714518 RepID=A0A978VXD0_ZIZJJ|nr:hypothetical protein FEM48_Zijuj02G0188100 [Ziziphus jujuba var. spinosa]
MARKLFDGSDSDDDDVSKIEVNKEYARRFEHNKKREDLQRYEELKKKGVISSSSSSEDESSDEESSSSEEESNPWFRPGKKKDLEFVNTLIMLREQNPALNKKDVELFKSDDDDEEEEKEAVEKKDKKEKKKAMYLKDVTAKHLLEEGPEFDNKDDGDDIDRGKKKKTYNEEQEEIRKAFLDEVDAMEEDGEDELLRVKNKVDDDDDDDSDIEELKKKADEYFDGDENSIFLKNFILKKSWLQKEDKDDFQIKNDESDILAEDDRIDTIEESEYRFQENAGDRIIGHSREVEDSVRKKVKARKEQRKRKEERMEIAKLEREEELRHFKNLKKKEIDERVKKIMESAGIREEEVVPLSAKELEEEFDPDEYDRMMKKAFGDKYYEAEDVDPGFGSDEDDGEIEKPDFEKEDELLGLPKGWDSSGDGDGFLATRERILKLNNDGDHEEGEEEEEEEEEEDEVEVEVKEEGKRKRKRKTALLEKAKEALMEEYYKLDYEDTIGDLKTRFKYAKIKPDRYGLSTADILQTDEKELNQFVPLKKLAPYNENEWKLPKKKKYQMKMKIEELRMGRKGNDKNFDKKKRIGNDASASTSSRDATEDEKAQLENTNGDLSNLSRKSRRKQRQAHLKLSQSRLAAYGKVASKPSKKE